MSPSAAVSGPPDFLDVNLAMLTVQEECQNEGDEEGDCVDDAEYPRGIKHAAVLLEVGCIRQTCLSTSITEYCHNEVER